MTAIIIDFANIYIPLKINENLNITDTTLDVFFGGRDLANTKIMFVINDDKKKNHSQLRYIRNYLSERPLIKPLAYIIGPNDVVNTKDADDLICMSLVINHKFLGYNVILLSGDFYKTELICKSIRVPQTSLHYNDVPQYKNKGDTRFYKGYDDSHYIMSSKFSGNFTRFGVRDRVLVEIN